MRTRTSTDLVACALALAALLVIMAFMWHVPPRVDRKLHGKIGEALARETQRLLGPGGQVILITRDTDAFPQPALDALLRSFKSELRRVGVTVASTQLLQIDPLRPTDVPAGDFFEALRRAPAGHVIVSLLGPPLLNADQRNKLGIVKPKVVAFCSGSQAEAIDLQELFKAGLLHAAVVSRAGAASGKSVPAVTPSTFEDLYATVRSGELTAAQEVP
jgi:hypothetical protein